MYLANRSHNSAHLDLARFPIVSVTTTLSHSSNRPTAACLLVLFLSLITPARRPVEFVFRVGAFRSAASTRFNPTLVQSKTTKSSQRNRELDPPVERLRARGEGAHEERSFDPPLLGKQPEPGRHWRPGWPKRVVAARIVGPNAPSRHVVRTKMKSSPQATTQLRHGNLFRLWLGLLPFAHLPKSTRETCNPNILLPRFAAFSANLQALCSCRLIWGARRG